jgi:uncharacterized membrane protein
MEFQIQKPVSTRVNVGPVERSLSLFTGAALLSYLLARRSKLTIPLGLEVGYLIYRGATGHCVVYQAMNIDRARQNGHAGIRIQRSITVNKPKEELYRVWRDFSNLPVFMNHLKSVEVDASNGGRISHWVAKAPLGTDIEWDSELTEDRENEYLAWRSLPDSTVESEGSVRFVDAPGGRGTEVHVSMFYNPPGGSLGAAFAKLFGEEPGQQVREDLRAFKQTMETGETPTIAYQPSGRVNREKDTPKPPAARTQRKKDIVQRSSEDSFPASDPPGWISEE